VAFYAPKPISLIDKYTTRVVFNENTPEMTQQLLPIL
jgi:hypothetical protein